jgi:hypothetical protein
MSYIQEIPTCQYDLAICGWDIIRKQRRKPCLMLLVERIVFQRRRNETFDVTNVTPVHVLTTQMLHQLLVAVFFGNSLV